MKWSRFWQRQRRDADLAGELEAYIAEETAAQVAAGKSPHDARDAAMRKLGNVTRIREDVYERNSLVTLETLWQDAAYAWRLVGRNPAFTLVAVMSIALGIGANTAVFTLLDRVLLRPLPVVQPDRLTSITTAGYQYGNATGDGNELSYPMYEDLRQNNDVFTTMFCRFAIPLDLGVGGSSERVRAELVSGTYFPTLGVTPMLGRVFDDTDDITPHGHPVVVVSHRYWRDRMGSDRDIVGRSIRVNNRAITVVGVAREGFYGTDVASAADVFMPIAMAENVTPITLRDRRTRWLNVFGRLKPGVTAQQAQASLQPFYSSRLAVEVQEDAFARASSSDKARFLEGSLDVRPAASGQVGVRTQLSGPLWTLTAIGGIVLVVACANVANLLLARASARRREMALRLALGASRRRLARQLLVESVLLALAGGLIGLLFATWGAHSLIGFLSERQPGFVLTAWPDHRILAMNVLVSVLAGILFGLAPAWQSSQEQVSPVLKAESAALTGGYARLRSGLVVVQLMLSLLVLVGAGLFLRSLHNLLAVDAGFDADRLLSFSVAPAHQGYEPVQTKSFAQTLLDRVRATPNITGAGFVSHALLEGGSWNNMMTIEGREYDPNTRVSTQNNLISPGYFSAMGIRLLAGRDFDARDEQHTEPGSSQSMPRVAIANEQFVKEFLDGRDPLGIHVGFGRDPGTPTPTEIVGVVTTAKYTSMRSEPRAQLYFPYFESASIGGFTMYVRTAQPPDTLMDTMRQVVQQIDPTLPVFDVRTVEQQIGRSLVRERVIASLSSVLAVLATLLAMVGLYGVMSYTVARRTREMTIRLALGAVSSRVAGLVVKDMLGLVACGVLLALPAIWFLDQLLRSQLYEVTPTDPSTILAGVGVLLIAACAAVWVPSRRALHVNPMAALREE